MKMFIPTLGYNFKLTKNWKFQLFFEDRNRKLFEYFDWEMLNFWNWRNVKTGEIYSNNVYNYTNLDPKFAKKYDKKYVDCMLPKNTVLKVDRIYIRQGAEEFDSVSFWAEIPDYKKKVRFWAKLNDVNNIEFGEVKNAK